MSTATLVMLAILVAATAISALSFIRWRDKKRLEQARSIITHSDFIMALNTIGSGLEPWLSASMLSFVGRSIQYHHQLLKEFNAPRSEEHTSELQSRPHLVCRLLLEKKKKTY